MGNKNQGSVRIQRWPAGVVHHMDAAISVQHNSRVATYSSDLFLQTNRPNPLEHASVYDQKTFWGTFVHNYSGISFRTATQRNQAVHVDGGFRAGSNSYASSSS